MNTDPIQRLLNEADSKNAACVSEASDLADRVWQHVHRAQRQRAIALRSAICLLCAMALVVSGRLSRHILPESRPLQSVKSAHDLASAKSALIDLQDQIRQREAAVQRLMLMEKLSSARRSLLRMNGDFNDPTERAAAAVVYEADRMRNSGLNDLASISYRQVLDLFPDTTSARTARQRLTSLDSKG